MKSFFSIIRKFSNVNQIKYHPSDYEHLLLTKHVQKDSKSGEDARFQEPQYSEFNELLLNWKSYSIFNSKSGYYGILYINEVNKHFVLAHRNTEPNIRDFSKTLAKNMTYLEIDNVIYNTIISQQISSYVAIWKASKILEQFEGYHFSTTGYSLGGLFASLGFFSYNYDFQKTSIKCVAFDPPGISEFLDKFSSNTKNTKINYQTMPIVTYLTPPTPINTCSGHVGELYKLCPDYITNSWIEELKHYSKLTKAKGIENHSFELISRIFDKDLGRPKKYTIDYIKMNDWIKMKTDDKQYTRNKEQGSSFNSVKELLSKQELDAPHHGMFDVLSTSTLSNIGKIIIDYSKNSIDESEYWDQLDFISLKLIDYQNPRLYYHVNEEIDVVYDKTKIQLHKNNTQYNSLDSDIIKFFQNKKHIAKELSADARRELKPIVETAKVVELGCHRNGGTKFILETKDNSFAYDKKMQLGLLFEKWLSKKQLDIVKDDCLVNDADRLTRVAAIYYGHGIYNVALEHLTNALKINHLFIGNGIDHKDIADNLYNIGLVYLNLKDYKKALQYHQEALQIRQRIFERDKNHQDITKSLEVCSTINSIMGIEENIKKLAKTFTFNEIKDLQNSEDEMNEEQEDEIWDNPTGKGTSDSSKESYWFEYSGVGVNSILKLRLAGIKNVEILRELIWDETTKFSIKQFIRSIIEINKEGSKIVLPINIYGKHWASLVIDGNIAYYLDSENHSIPTQMKEALIDLKLEVFEVETEQQYYNNCGVEMIENIVFVLTGERVTQEKAIFLHSMLFERHLHNSNSILKKTEKIIREYIENRANKITYLKDVVLKKDYKLVLVDEYGNQFEVQNLQSENKNKENIFALGYKLVLKANYVNYTIKKSIDMGDIDEKLKAQAEYYLRTGRLFDSARNANISNIVQEEVTYGESFTELSHFNSYTYEDLIAGLTNYFLNNVVVSTI